MPRLRSQQTGSVNCCIKFLIFNPGWLQPIRTCCHLLVTVLLSEPSFTDLEIRFGLARPVRMAALVDELQTLKLRNVQVRRPVNCIIYTASLGSSSDRFSIWFAASSWLTYTLNDVTAVGSKIDVRMFIFTSFSLSGSWMLFTTRRKKNEYVRRKLPRKTDNNDVT